MSLMLRSTAFGDGGDIPRRHTCQGVGLSPPLAWTGAPEGTRTFALIVDDPDAPDPAAPKQTFVHWVLYDLPSDCASLAEAVSVLPPGTREGRNDRNATGYVGPCPPIGRHRYVHKLFALDVELGDLNTPTAAELAQAIDGHLLERAELVGMYRKI